jgi:hypothetical protein
MKIGYIAAPGMPDKAVLAELLAKALDISDEPHPIAIVARKPASKPIKRSVKNIQFVATADVSQRSVYQYCDGENERGCFPAEDKRDPVLNRPHNHTDNVHPALPPGCDILIAPSMW